MSDPVAEIISLLKPNMPFSKLIEAAGSWRVKRSNLNKVYYCMFLEGKGSLEVDGNEPVNLKGGDFVLVPNAVNITMSSTHPVPPKSLVTEPKLREDGVIVLGDSDQKLTDKMLIGYCLFASPDSDFFVSLLPNLVVVRNQSRFKDLSRLILDEVMSNRPAKDVILEHLLQVLLIETFRYSPVTNNKTSVLHGLADKRLAKALRCMHGFPQYAWHIEELAREAGLSRTSFTNKFNSIIGVPPMKYLQGWRMSLAKQYLRTREISIAEIAEKTGYGSSSAFSVAFSREVGFPPAYFSKNC